MASVRKALSFFAPSGLLGRRAHQRVDHVVEGGHGGIVVDQVEVHMDIGRKRTLGGGTGIELNSHKHEAARMSRQARMIFSMSSDQQFVAACRDRLAPAMNSFTAMALMR